MLNLIKFKNGEVILCDVTDQKMTSVKIKGALEITASNNPFAPSTKSMNYWLPIPFDRELELRKTDILIQERVDDIESLNSVYKKNVEVAKVRDKHKSKELLTEDEESLDQDDGKVVPIKTYSSKKLSKSDSKFIKELLEEYEPDEGDIN
jgi:hypothetical protein